MNKVMQWLGVIYFFVVYILICLEVMQMDNLVYAIIIAGGGIVTSIIGAIVAILTTNKHCKDIDKHLGFDSGEQSLAKKLGVGEKSITSLLGVDERSITSQIGVGENDLSLSSQHEQMTKSIVGQTGVTDRVKSLTEQHKEIYTMLSSHNEKLSGIAGFLHDSQIRRESADTSQENLVHTMAAFQQAFIDTINRNSALDAENRELKQRLSQYIMQYGELNNNPSNAPPEDDGQETIER